MTDPSSARRLADEHDELLGEIAVRQQRVRDALGEGRWPAGEIDGLLGYLRYELLDQAVHEERLLYPMTTEGFGDPRIQQLVEDHVRLRDLADELAVTAAAAPPDRDTGRLLTTLTALHDQLRRHLRAEQDVLSPVTAVGVESVRQPYRAHEWFALTEGPVLDMDQLPRAFAHSAVMDRLVRMRQGEAVELQSGTPLDTLDVLLTRSGLTAQYGWDYLQEGPDRWRAQITRRPDPV